MQTTDDPDLGAIHVEETAYPPRFAGDWHDNSSAQLIYPSAGIMSFHTAAGLWVVPPMRACWLPARVEHRVEAPAGLTMHSVYCRGAFLDRLPRAPGIVAVSPLLREVILALAAGPDAERAAALATLFVTEVAVLPDPPLFLPQLRAARLLPIQAVLAADPADPRTLEQWAAELATTPRSLARAFARDAGMSFTAYRRQARLRAAVARLAAGRPVTATALDLGFDSASHFIKLFRHATGATPGRYFARVGG